MFKEKLLASLAHVKRMLNTLNTCVLSNKRMMLGNIIFCKYIFQRQTYSKNGHLEAKKGIIITLQGKRTADPPQSEAVFKHFSSNQFFLFSGQGVASESRMQHGSRISPVQAKLFQNISEQNGRLCSERRHKNLCVCVCVF